MRYTYNLNSYFQFCLGDFRNGTLDYTLPALDAGRHELQLRAWDVLNNSSVLTLAFVVADTGDPTGITDVERSTFFAEQSGRAERNVQRFFDLQGRRHATVNDSRPSLMIYRGADGKMKKKVFRRQ